MKSFVTNRTVSVGPTGICAPAGPFGVFQMPSTTAVVEGIWKTPNGPAGAQIPVGPTDTVRFVTNDFMFTGGDGYTVFASGTNVQQPGDDLLQVAIDYVTANSPVAPVVDG